MNKGELLFDGNEKQVYSTESPDVVLIHFKDIATAFNNIKRAVVLGKGIVNNAISSYIFTYLRNNGIDTHFIEKTGEREQLCRKIEVIPLQIVVRNYAAGTLADRLGLEEGYKPANVIYDLRYNNDELGDPLINDSQATGLGIATPADLAYMYETAAKVNDLLQSLFSRAGIKLVDIKLEFGRATDGSIILSDEISPDSCRLWDIETGRKLDKDRFRHDLSDVMASYREVWERLSKLNID